MQPELAARAEHPAGPVRLRTILEAGEPPERAERALAGLDAMAFPSGKDGAWRLQATVAPERLGPVISRLASLPEVEAVEIARPLRPMNQDAVWVHQSFVGSSPQQTPIFNHGIFGCGQTLGLADTGQDYDLCFFPDSVNDPPPFSSCLSAPCPSATPATNRRKDVLYYNWSGTPTGNDDTCPPILGASGTTTISLPGSVWFLVAGTDGASTDGSWSRDALGNEKNYAGASAACPAITQHLTNNGCP